MARMRRAGGHDQSRRLKEGVLMKIIHKQMWEAT